MKAIYLAILVYSILLLASSCKSSQETSQGDAHSYDGVYVAQNGEEVYIKDESAMVTVERAPFALRFYNHEYRLESEQFHAGRIAALKSKKLFESIQRGMALADIHCFVSGSGMAPHASGTYESLIITNKGHHYLPYENIENNRVQLLNRENDWLKLEFKVKAVYHDDQDFSLNDTRLNEIYLVLVLDRNLNGVIDKGELSKLTIRLKQRM